MAEYSILQYLIVKINNIVFLYTKQVHLVYQLFKYDKIYDILIEKL